MTLFQAFGQFAGQAAVPAVTAGMVLMKPTSISNTSGSATLGTNGQVTFSGITLLSVNGCFTADYDNYVVSVRGTTSTSGAAIMHRLRASAVDASGADYDSQYLEAEGANVTGIRSTNQTERPWSSLNSTTQQGFTVYVYGPFLAEPTVYASVSVQAFNNATITDYRGIHDVSSSYDGFSLYPSAGGLTVSGALQVYGVKA